MRTSECEALPDPGRVKRPSAVIDMGALYPANGDTLVGYRLAMATKSEDLRREALGLSEAERADLAADLLASLETPTADEDPSVARSLWGAEIERRARRAVAGDATTEDWNVVRKRLTDALGD
jgi:hypothetical protein